MSRHINKPQSALLLGAGYVARALAPHLIADGWDVHVTTRSGETTLPNVTCHKFRGAASADLQSAFVDADIIVSSIPPAKDSTDPALSELGHLTPKAKWIAYLSATSVYGDRAGQWAFEGEAPSPSLQRGKARAEAELAWIETLWPVHIFRLAGIYGSGRAPFEKLRSGKARTIIKEGHIVNRIHVGDIVSALLLSLQKPNPQTIFNIADGHPAPPQDVLDYAAGLLGLPPAPRVDLHDPSVSTMARSFYAETKRINADKARRDLGWVPKFSSYRDGLTAILAEES
ncbi:MAG: SDR family oxidoreductase [Litorimonas sp.]